MDSALKVHQYFAAARLEEAKPTVDLAMLIVRIRSLLSH